MTSLVMLDPWALRVSETWRGPADEPLPEHAKLVKPKLVREDTTLFAQRFIKMRSTAVLQRSVNHIAAVRALRGFRVWKAFRDIMTAEEKRLRGAINRMRMLPLSRAWEQWQVKSRFDRCPTLTPTPTPTAL